MRLWCKVLPVLVLFCALPSNVPAWAQSDIEARLRIVWGGGTARRWQGSLQVNRGVITDVRDLGAAPDSPGTKELVKNQVIIDATSELSFDGFDVTVQGSPNSTIVLELHQPNQSAMQEPQRFELALNHFTSAGQSESWDLDEMKNTVVMRPVPGDDLRVRFNREMLVFSPGETFTSSIQPNLIDVGPNALLRMRMQVLAARSDEEVWSSQENLQSDNDGTIIAPPMSSITVPEVEGVYDLVISLYRRGRIDVPGWRSSPITERTVQFVVIDPERTPPEPAEWEEAQTVDPTNPGWRAWATKIPGMSLLPGMEARPLTNSNPKAVEYANTSMLELAPGEWQAYPIPIDAEGRPHLLEVEIPEGTPQTLGISIIEPTATGDIVPIGIDSGVFVPDNTTVGQRQVARHRIVFWPRSKAPLVMLVNHRRDKAAYFGRIRVYSGPDELPAAPVSSIASERLFAATFDKPLFAENFSADGQLDPLHQQMLDDWSKFYWGTRRLVEYLKYAGFNGAVVCVAREGSALYPSSVLGTTPRYDSGIYFNNGQDPVRKDVLEMMFRIFDREGLVLIPAVHFSGRMERLERIRRSADDAGEGILLQHVDGTKSTTHYNPLHPQVQEAMRAAVREIAQRYSQHPAFDGLALQLAADSYAILPDDRWAIDSSTLNRFRRTAFNGTEPEEVRKFSDGADLLRNSTLRKEWLQWRARELATFYAGLYQTIRDAQYDGRLWLLTNDLYSGRTQQSILQPGLPEPDVHPVVAASLVAGIEAKFYREPGIVLLRPHRYSASGVLNDQGVNIQLQSTDVDDYFRGLETAGEHSSGAQIYCEQLSLSLPLFDQLRPFGSRSSRTELHTHARPAGIYNRQHFAHALAALDAHHILEGGSMLALGQEESLLPLVETFRLLPRQPFQLVSPESPDGTEPVVVRVARHDGRTYFYMVNDSPWPVRVTLEYAGRMDMRLQPLGSRTWPTPFSRVNRWSWTVDMEPYDVVGATLSDPLAEIVGWQVQLSPDIPRDLKRQITSVRERAAAAAAPHPLPAPRNLNFEEAPLASGIAGWEFKQGPGLSVQLDAQNKNSGRFSLHMSNQAVEPATALWLRSEAFPVPSTGRLYVLVRLRTRDASQQPTFRVALDDKRGYYEPRTVGRGPRAVPLPDQWGEDFLFAFEQLPVHRLEKLHLGFDLMSTGDVWIDDIQVFDMWFQTNERNALLIASALAEKDLSESLDIRSAQQFLDSFWPRFLLNYGRPESSTLQDPIRAAALPSEADDGNSRKSTIDQIRNRVPKVPFRMPFNR